MRARLSESLTGLLYSDRPRWAMMPGYVATHFTHALLFTAALLDELHIPWIAHYGTLLGAVRLGGVAPWDEDADLYVLTGRLDELQATLEPHLVRHGFESILRPSGDALIVRRRPWLAGQGHIGLSLLPPPLDDDVAPESMTWDAYLQKKELMPIRRVPFYSSHVFAPAHPEPLLWRLYADSGSPLAMNRFCAPAISAECARFWAKARPFEGPTDWPSISDRFVSGSRRWSHLRTFPWWWFNGAYNIGIGHLRRAGRALR